MRKINLIFFSFFLLCFSCNENNDEDKSALQRVDFLKRNMMIPLGYNKMNVKEFSKMIQDSIYENTLSDYDIKNMRRFENFARYAEFFVDKEDVSNVIAFHQENYIKMSKEALDIYVDIMEREFFVDYEGDSLYDSVKYKKLESKYSDYGLANVVKVKYLQTYNKDSTTNTYMTHYLVSHNLKSFGVVVLNNKNKDFQYILDTFKL
ncbi:MAG: hypothetical protein HKP48_10600 [Winogradskyella sp.]|uniref:hypothetical protein n=1 Tax=Winogradskyella sp. TaxID=1883156 RepID=UPI0017F8B421|nr:hypothetical protein [Winogradskyella sp.]MBT8245913.1 hypothetical protein [Winogradskyella sp.]NNK23713.1 hypothetical protein [Winogradskyella sp.]